MASPAWYPTGAPRTVAGLVAVFVAHPTLRLPDRAVSRRRVVPLSSHPATNVQARIDAGETVVFYDGHCNLCDGFVRFVVERDRRARIAFAPLQSEEAAEFLGPRLESGEDYRSLIVVDDAGVRLRSAGALRVASRLGWPWRAAAAFLVVPRPIRDAVYDWVARNRFRWFGRRDDCRLPTEAERGRFL